MSKFDELKRVCEITQAGNVDFTINSTQILELLAIQEQLVEALESVFKIQIENYGDAISTHINLTALTTKVQDAIFAARAQP